MKTIIAGSRTLHGVELVEEAVRRSGFTVGTVISGAASGIDRAGEAWLDDRQRGNPPCHPPPGSPLAPSYAAGCPAPMLHAGAYKVWARSDQHIPGP